MKTYRIVYKCKNGFIGEEFIDAVNRMMAYELFGEFGYKDIVAIDCLLVVDENGNEYLENYTKTF